MGNAINLAAAHRFHDELSLTACDHENGATVNLSLAQARQLRASIGRIIRSIERERYSQAPSGLGCEISTRDRRYSHGAKIEREGN